MNKKGQFSSISWRGGSVSGLVVIAGLIIYFFKDQFIGVVLILLGLAAALIMSPVGRRLFGR